MHSSWSCRFDKDGKCTIRDNKPCDPGDKGCVLDGKYKVEKKEINKSYKLKNRRPPGGK